MPTGHFGDILAGYVAKRIGLPVERLVIAANKNDILARTLNEGVDAHSTYGVAIIFETGPANPQVNGTTGTQTLRGSNALLRRDICHAIRTADERHKGVAMGGFMKAIVAAGFALFLAGGATAQESVANFYRGKTIQMIVGTSAGGGYDLYGRLAARYMSRYIPGNPNIVVSNMAGAASIVATQHIGIAAPKDGTVIGAIFPGALIEQLIGDKGKVRYDARKLTQIGSANNELYVCIVRADAGVKSFDDFLKGNILIGASAAGGSTRDFPLLLTSVLGANFKVVSGYPGSNEILLAIEKGEVQGTCGIGWSTISVQRAQWLRDGFVKVVAQEGMRSYPELDRQGVPLAYSFAKTPEQQQVMQVHYEPLTFGRPFIAAPEVPAERVEALQAAFMKAMADPELRAEAERLKLDIAPTAGKEVAAIVQKIFELPPAAIEAARVAIGSK